MTKIKNFLGYILGFSLGTFFYSHLNLIHVDGEQTWVSLMSTGFRGTSSNVGGDQSVVKDEKSFITQTKPQEEKEQINLVVGDSAIVTDTHKSSGVESEEIYGHGDEKSEVNSEHFCSMLGKSDLSTPKLWNRNIPHILNISDARTEDNESFDDFRAMLMHVMSPERLNRGVKNLPSEYWPRVGEIIDLVYKRWNYFKQGNTEGKGEPRKVNLLVVGGSVSMGMECEKNPINGKSKLGPRECSWAWRLSTFLNKLDSQVPGGLFYVKAMTVGGTNTVSGTTLWDYAIYPNTPFPDIVIHGYSTNDMHVLSEVQAKSMNMTLEDMILHENDKFIRKVLEPLPVLYGKKKTVCSPKPPLLLYFDDYIGNEQRDILQTLAFSNAAKTLSTYYGIGMISYADAVRDIVYADTNETWFSPELWPERNVHPSMSMHITSTWIVAYYLLNVVTNYCSFIGDDNKLLGVHDTVSDRMNPFLYAAKNGLPELNGDIPWKTILHKPRVGSQLAIKPPLDADLSLDTITRLWGKANKIKWKRNNRLKLPECPLDTTLSFQRMCEYAWIAHMPKHPKLAKQVDSAMKPVLISNEGWKGQLDSNKAGFVATTPDANFVMELKSIKIPIEVFTLIAMTSYGDKWADSQIEVEMFVARQGEDIEKVTKSSGGGNILGYHDKHTSESVDHKFTFAKGANVGDTIRIKIKMVGGTTFKINGLLLCDH